MERTVLRAAFADYGAGGLNRCCAKSWRNGQSGSASGAGGRHGGDRRPAARPLLVLDRGLLGDQPLEAGQRARGRGAPSSIAARTAHPGSRSCLQSRNRQWSISSNTSANARSMPVARQPQADRPHARRVDQPATAGQGEQLGGDRGVAAALVARRGPRVVSCTSRAEQGVDERRLADAAGAEERQRPAAVGERPQLLDPGAGAPARDEHRHAEGHLDAARAAAGSGSSTRSALVSTTAGSAPLSKASTSSRSSRRWFGGDAEGVDEEDDVDVGGERVGLGPRPLERRPADERRPAGQHVLDPLAVADGTTQSPTATSAPMLRTRAGGIGCRRRPRRTVLQPRSSRDTRPGAPATPSRYATPRRRRRPSRARSSIGRAHVAT